MVAKEKNLKKMLTVMHSKQQSMGSSYQISVVSRLEISKVLYQAHRKGYLVWTMELPKPSRCCKHFLTELTRQHSRYPRCYYLEPIEFIMYIVSQFYLSFQLFKNDRVQTRTSQHFTSPAFHTLPEWGAMLCFRLELRQANIQRMRASPWVSGWGTLPSWYVRLSPIILLVFYGIHCVIVWYYLVFSKADFKTIFSN